MKIFLEKFGHVTPTAKGLLSAALSAAPKQQRSAYLKFLSFDAALSWRGLRPYLVTWLLRGKRNDFGILNWVLVVAAIIMLIPNRSVIIRSSGEKNRTIMMRVFNLFNHEYDTTKFDNHNSYNI